MAYSELQAKQYEIERLRAEVESLKKKNKELLELNQQLLDLVAKKGKTLSRELEERRQQTRILLGGKVGKA